jgi:hypothetical protein
MSRIMDKKTELKEETATDKTELHELKFADVLSHRKQIKAAIGTANVVTGDQVKATKVKAPKT